MYRIMQARNGFFYVQKLRQWGQWTRASGFEITKAACRSWVAREKHKEMCCRSALPRVIEYL